MLPFPRREDAQKSSAIWDILFRQSPYRSNCSTTYEKVRFTRRSFSSLVQLNFWKTTPDGDPEMRLYNLELLDKYCREGKPVVFARIPVEQDRTISQESLNLYVPVAA